MHASPQTSLMNRAGQLQVGLLPRRFPLNLVHEVKVWLVEVVYAHVTVLSSTAVSGALRVHGDVVEGSKVTTDTANLLHEDLVVETRFKLSLAGRGGSDIHGGLSSTKDNVVFYGRDGGAVERCVGNIGLENGKIFDIDELQTVSIEAHMLRRESVPWRTCPLTL
jgi:hypothetical protein